MTDVSVTLTRIGGPTLLIGLLGLRLLTAPTFDAPGRYRSGTVTLKKTSGPAVPAADVGHVDGVLLHDQHFDNLDRSGRAFLQTAGTTFTSRAGASRHRADQR
jgi:L-ascorbate metabolism protein UlaG (beta-lactamase superfamily)